VDRLKEDIHQSMGEILGESKSAEAGDISILYSVRISARTPIVLISFIDFLSPSRQKLG
jgi:hypothetical protein